MKVIKIKLEKKAYFDYYVGATLSLFFNLTRNESTIVSSMLYYINLELEDDVPLKAAIRLVSMSEYRDKIKAETLIKSNSGELVEISYQSYIRVLKSLIKKGIINELYEFNASYVIRHTDGGFKVEIKEDIKDA